MSVYLHFDDEMSGDQVGSSSGWGDVIEWSETLPQDHYENLLHLLQHGWTEDIDETESELREAMEFYASDKSDVVDTLNGLRDKISSRPTESEVVHISNGMGEDDSVDDDSPELSKSVSDATPGNIPENHGALATALQSFFNDQRAETLSYSGKVPDVEQVKRKNDLQRLLMPFMLAWATDGGTEALTELKAPHFAEKTFTEALPAETTKAAKFFADKITTTTYNRVTQYLENEPPDASAEAIAAAVNRAFDDAVDNRADTIGEDLSYKGKVLGQYVAAKASGIAIKKMWIAYEGACPVCAAMDGIVVEIDDPFATSLGDSLYPGEVHPLCRCRLGIILDTGEVVIL